jgi:hypothetical protein
MPTVSRRMHKQESIILGQILSRKFLLVFRGIERDIIIRCPGLELFDCGGDRVVTEPVDASVVVLLDVRPDAPIGTRKQEHLGEQVVLVVWCRLLCYGKAA